MRSINTLQIGMEWHADGAGSGVDRVYNALVHTLPDQCVGVQGLVFGNGAAASPPSHVHLATDVNASLPRRLQKSRRTFREIMNSFPVDLVATHFSLYTLPVLDLLNERPLVVHFHGPWALESKAEGESNVTVHLKKWIERAVYRRGTRFIVLSEAFKTLLTSRYDVDPAAVRIVPGGVDTNRFDATGSRWKARQQLGWDVERPTIFAVRRLVKRVGVEELVEAARTVVRDHPSIQMYIAGKGPLHDTLAQRIEENDLGEHVTLLGFVSDELLPAAYRAADMTVVPTQSLEGFGLVAVESLAAGTPVLVTPVGGLPEIVRPLSPSLVMHDSSPAGIADSLKEVLRGDRSLPSPNACRSHATAHYSWPVIARQIRSVYEEVLS